MDKLISFMTSVAVVDNDHAKAKWIKDVYQAFLILNPVSKAETVQVVRVPSKENPSLFDGLPPPPVSEQINTEEPKQLCTEEPKVDTQLTLHWVKQQERKCRRMWKVYVYHWDIFYGVYKGQTVAASKVYINQSAISNTLDTWVPVKGTSFSFYSKLKNPDDIKNTPIPVDIIKGWHIVESFKCIKSATTKLRLDHGDVAKSIIVTWEYKLNETSCIRRTSLSACVKD